MILVARRCVARMALSPRYLALLCLAPVILNACSVETEPSADETSGAAIVEPDTTFELGPLERAIASDSRSEAERARDEWRNPKETLEFFDVQPDHTVIEVWPGGGWYTKILAPYLKETGRYIAAGFDPSENDFFAQATNRFSEAFLNRPEMFGDITLTELSASSGAIAPDNSADVVLTFRNVHNWMAGGYAEKAFGDMFAALKPGGILGVVEHRLPSAATQDPQAATGYVHEDFVKTLAVEAGFEFVEASDINANVNDSTVHPFGVWTLPPVSRTTDREGNTPEDFNPAKYSAIGESDRMTLKFRKPEANTPLSSETETNTE